MRFNTSLRTSVIAAFLTAVCANVTYATAPENLPDADIYILGELHDQKAHHAVQADWVLRIKPTALVFEMLSSDQVDKADGVDRTDQERLGSALGWSDGAWPDFSMYFPIFAAAPEAKLYGAAVPISAVRQAMSDGAASVFGDDAEQFGLTKPLPDAEQQLREQGQAEAHCNALPETMLPGMVEAQRLRDAHFSRVALKAFRDTGGPVVVITGNGHARADWGMPVYLNAAAPEVAVFSMGQGAEGSNDSGFDLFLPTGFESTGEDPCAAFKSN